MHLRWGPVPLALLFCTLSLHSQAVPAEGRAKAVTGDPLSPLMRSGMAGVDPNMGNNTFAYMYQNFMTGVESAKEADAGNLSLQVLAEQSGGRAVGPTGDVYGSIVRCVADATAYYELSFDSAPADEVDVYRGLQVRLDKPGLTGRTNTGYYAQP